MYVQFERFRAAQYSRELSDKVWRGCVKISEQGYWAGGMPPYGLQRLLLDERREPVQPLEPGQRKGIQNQRVTLVEGDPAQVVAVIRRIFHEFVDLGHSEYKIAEGLSRDGVAPPGGQRWGAGSVRARLRNEKYAGTVIYNRTSQKLKSPRHPNPPVEWVRTPEAFDGIISPEQFQRAQELQTERRQKYEPAAMLAHVRTASASSGRAAGVTNPFDEHLKRPLDNHVDDFELYLRHKGNTRKHVVEFSKKVRFVAKACKWRTLGAVSANGLPRFLADLRLAGRSAQTTNHYLRAVKSFGTWLVKDRRLSFNPFAHLSMLNVQLDKRHHRRPLSAEEFTRLLAAAEDGPPVEAISGKDRAMLYVPAAWTGLRRNELGSLTLRSLALDGSPPTLTVAAAYSKRKRQDVQVLHGDVVERLRAWLKTKQWLTPDDLLFPVAKNGKGGADRKTSKMMRVDLAAARETWLDEAPNAVERARREATYFLLYVDSSGRYADFHATQHTFITNLEKAGVSPRLAQTSDRHADIRLTMSVYTHVGLADVTAAIETLGGIPKPDRALAKDETKRVSA